MPEILCKICKNRCGMFINSQYHMNYLAAWAKGQPLPECDHYQQATFHGLEGVLP